MPVDISYLGDMFAWRVPIYMFIVLVVLGLTPLLYSGPRWAVQLVTGSLFNRSKQPGRRAFFLHKELVKTDNRALAVSYAGFVFAVATVLTGSLFPVRVHPGTALVEAVWWTGVGVCLLTTAQVVNDVVFQYRYHNFHELMQENVAVGIVEAGHYVASGLVVYGAISPGLAEDVTSFDAAESFSGEKLGSTLLFFVMGQVEFFWYILAHRIATRYNDTKQIRDGNVAAATSAAFQQVAIGTIIGTTTSRTEALLVHFVIFLAAVPLLLLVRSYVDRGLLWGHPLDKAVEQGNWGAAMVEGGVCLSAAVLLTTTVPLLTGCSE